MILFLNFAPLSFGGGVERWIVSVANELSISEKVVTLQVDKEISNIYAKLVLKRTFLERFKLESKKIEQKFIKFATLIPFSTSGNKVRNLLANSRVIYTKFEVNELLLLFYFGGHNILKKTVIGLHSPFLYTGESLSFFAKLHNVIYSSFLSRFVLSKCKKIHVLSELQEQFLIDNFHLQNIVKIPNYIEKAPKFSVIKNSDILNVTFIGELDHRKGADTLLKIVSNSPKNYIFTVVGDGNLKEQFNKNKLTNLKYIGYVNNEEIQDILKKSDVFLQPSRAESFPLATIEALSHGVAVVGSPIVKLKIIEKYLVINSDETLKEYINILLSLHKQKMDGTLLQSRKKTWNNINSTLSKERIITELKKHIFN